MRCCICLEIKGEWHQPLVLLIRTWKIIDNFTTILYLLRFVTANSCIPFCLGYLRNELGDDDHHNHRQLHKTPGTCSALWRNWLFTGPAGLSSGWRTAPLSAGRLARVITESVCPGQLSSVQDTITYIMCERLLKLVSILETMAIGS